MLVSFQTALLLLWIWECSKRWPVLFILTMYLIAAVIAPVLSIADREKNTPKPGMPLKRKAMAASLVLMGRL